MPDYGFWCCLRVAGGGCLVLFVRFRYCDLMRCGVVAVACFAVGCLRVIGGFGWGLVVVLGFLCGCLLVWLIWFCCLLCWWCLYC